MDARTLRFAALAVVVAVALSACSTRRAAPVVDRGPGGAPAPVAKALPDKPADPRPPTYTVKRGDTLYQIALDNGLDWRELAEWNGITNANRIFVGQELRVRAPVPAATASVPPVPPVQGRPLEPAPSASNVVSEPRAERVPYSDQALARLTAPPATATAAIKPEPKPEPAKPVPVAPVPPAAEPDDENVAWAWPATGRLSNGYSESATLKGIGIAGKTGQPVLAAAPGRVVYSGSGLRGYGKLVIIKHNKEYLSVYAHNRELLVKEGQGVTRGQKIAEMGGTDADIVKLHFEIRRYGKPVDPLKLLPEKVAG
ncbi:MAG: peptidoglycan DD-metalloendopeptidase family protein [Burkholderiales bacterium]